MTCLSAGSQAPRTMTSLAYNNSLAPSSALVLTTILWEKFRYPQNYVQLCAVPIQITEGREYLQPNGGISVSYSMTLDNKIRRYTKVRTKSTATIIITSVKRTRALPHSALTSGGTPVSVIGAWYKYMPEYGVVPHCRFGNKIVRATFDSTVRIVCIAPPAPLTDENSDNSFWVSLNGVDFIDTGFSFSYYEQPIIYDVT